MKIIVQKFGGTSVAKPEFRQKVIDRIINTKKEGFFPVVVVSALRYNGCPYSTDGLLKLAEDCSIIDIASLRELDMLASCGELIACPLVAIHLIKEGYPARGFAGFQAGIITDENFGRATIKKIDINFINSYIEKGIIPVVSGFQGITEAGEITTLGRGGSDITAVALGYSLKAERVEFYKEVDGIMSADPYIIPSAQKLSDIGYDEIGEMTCCGSKVLEASSVEMSKHFSVPMVVKNTFNPDVSGTLIRPNKSGEINFSKPVTAIAHITNVAQVHIELPVELNGAKIEKIFKYFFDSSISLDFIALNPNDLLFIVDMKMLDKTIDIILDMDCKFSVVKDCSKVSVIGAAMRGVPGVMYRAFSALRREGIKVLCSTDSHITIAFLVHCEDEKRAIDALHKEFIEL